MKAVIQRVSKASVTVDAEILAVISNGMLILLGIEDEDTHDDIQWLSNKIVNLRIFPDENDVMNLSLKDANGDAIVVSQFTLHASTKKGNRPSFVRAARPEQALPLYEMFIGPLEKAAPWSTKDIQGVLRFLQRAYRLLLHDEPDGTSRLQEQAPGDGTPEQARLTAATIAGVTADIEAVHLNTAISKLMVMLRDITKNGPLPENAARAFVLLLSPFAPHLGEELWQRLGNGDTLAYEPWPEADAALLLRETITLAVQLNGKRRDEITVAADAEEEAIAAAAVASEGAQRHLQGREPRKVIVIPGRLVNIVG